MYMCMYVYNYVHSYIHTYIHNSAGTKTRFETSLAKQTKTGTFLSCLVVERFKNYLSAYNEYYSCSSHYFLWDSASLDKEKR